MENKSLKLRVSLSATIAIVNEKEEVVNDLGNYDFGTKIMNMDSGLLDAVSDVVTNAIPSDLKNELESSESETLTRGYPVEYCQGVFLSKRFDNRISVVVDKATLSKNAIIDFYGLTPWTVILKDKKKYIINKVEVVIPVENIEKHIITAEESGNIIEAYPHYVYKISDIRETMINYFNTDINTFKTCKKLFITTGAIISILGKFDLKWSEFEEKIFKLEKITRESLIKNNEDKAND